MQTIRLNNAKQRQRLIILKSYELLYKCLLSSARLLCQYKMPYSVAVFVCFILQRPVLTARQMTDEQILVAKYLPKGKSIFFFFFFFFSPLSTIVHFKAKQKPEVMSLISCAPVQTVQYLCNRLGA